MSSRYAWRHRWFLNPFRVQRRIACAVLVSLFFLLLLTTASSRPISKSRSRVRPANTFPGCRSASFASADNAGVATQTTAGEGLADFPNLADGEYRVVILAPGFAEQSQQITLPQTPSLTVELKLTTAPQTVVVTGSSTPATAEQTASSVGVLTGEQLKLLIRSPPAMPWDTFPARW